MKPRCRWRVFTGAQDEEFVTVSTYEAVRGSTYEEKNGRMVAIEHVTHERAIALMRGTP